MKYLIILLVLLLKVSPVYEMDKSLPVITFKIPAFSETGMSWDALIKAIYEKETRSGIYSIGDGGRAIGPLQIHKVMVDDVNRILGKKYFRYSDRKDFQKSSQIFRIYQEYYNPGLNIKTAARIWNGGPTGEKKRNTLKYATEVLSLYHYMRATRKVEKWGVYSSLTTNFIIGG